MNKEQALKTMKFEDLSNDELSELLWMVNKDQYKERPVTINEFIESDEFVHKKWNNVFPIWRGVLNEIYPTPFNAPYNEILISAAAGAGKCLAKDTPILMYDKTEKMVQDVKPNDILMGNDGTKRNVLSINRGNELLYKVTLKDESTFTCNKSHILHLKNEYGKVLNINIEDYLKNKHKYTNYFHTKLDDNKLYNFHVEDIGKGNYYGFTIDGNHLFTLGNGIITHNTVTATIGTLYDMYKLGCLKNPCEFYGLAPGTMLIMAVFSATGSTAAVNWQDITTGIEACPWMMTRIVDRRGLEKKSGSLVPVEILPGIFIQTGSKFQHSMGKAIFDGLMDEAAFGGDNLKDAVKTYNELSSRMATRFRKFSKTGNLPGHLFLISSPKEAGDFMQYRIDTAKKSNSRFTLIKQNISSWDADPRNDSDDKFTVFVGNEFKEPKIYEDGEEPSFEDLDYLIYPPKSYLDNFKQDILGAIMNYGGVTTVADTGLFKSPTVVGECMILKNPFHMNIIKLPFDANDIQLMDFMDMSYFKDIRHPECNRFIHIDVAFSSNTIDRYGLAAGYCTLADRSVIRKEGENIAEIYNRAEKMFYIDWAIGIEPVKGQEVPLSKVEEFIKYLRKIGYPIASVSADTFNSKQTLQNLEQMKFDTQSISVDRSRDPYLQLKRFIYNKQILIPNVPELKIELLKLRDSGKKIDHNLNGCVIGNTKISLFGQEDTTIEELAKKGKEYKFWVNAYKDNVIIPALAYNAHLTKYVNELITLTIKDPHKHEITCTLDHKILTPNGYKQAYDLEIEEEIVTENGIGKLVIMEINRVPKTPVYDITVPIYENFIANGIVIHNSKDISDAVAGCIWNCSQQPNKTVNIARLTASILNPNGYFNMSDEEKDIAQQMEYERLRGSFGNIFKGL